MYKCQAEPGEKQEWYSVEAAAAYLTIGTTTIYKAIQQRKIRHVRYGEGKSIRISHNDLAHWIEEQTKPTLAEINRENLKRRKNRPAGRQAIRRAKRGRPPLWPPTTTASLRRLANRIEQNILKEDTTAS